MTTLTGHQIEAARLLTLRQMLKLEIKGMSKSRGPTAYSTLKMMGLKGSRESVLAQLDKWREHLLTGSFNHGPSAPPFQQVGDIVDFSKSTQGESK